MDYEERNRDAEVRWWKWCHEQTRPELWRPLRDEIKHWAAEQIDILLDVRTMKKFVYIIYPAVLTAILVLAILLR